MMSNTSNLVKKIAREKLTEQITGDMVRGAAKGGGIGGLRNYQSSTPPSPSPMAQPPMRTGPYLGGGMPTGFANAIQNKSAVPSPAQASNAISSTIKGIDKVGNVASPTAPTNTGSSGRPRLSAMGSSQNTQTPQGGGISNDQSRSYMSKLRSQERNYRGPLATDAPKTPAPASQSSSLISKANASPAPKAQSTVNTGANQAPQGGSIPNDAGRGPKPAPTPQQKSTATQQVQRQQRQQKQRQQIAKQRTTARKPTRPVKPKMRPTTAWDDTRANMMRGMGQFEEETIPSLVKESFEQFIRNSFLKE